MRKWEFALQVRWACGREGRQPCWSWLGALCTSPHYMSPVATEHETLSMAWGLRPLKKGQELGVHAQLTTGCM